MTFKGEKKFLTILDEPIDLKLLYFLVRYDTLGTTRPAIFLEYNSKPLAGMALLLGLEKRVFLDTLASTAVAPGRHLFEAI